jgi:hypothetical protein
MSDYTPTQQLFAYLREAANEATALEAEHKRAAEDADRPKEERLDGGRGQVVRGRTADGILPRHAMASEPGRRRRRVRLK